MYYYIALGGVGCRTLARYAVQQNIADSACFYIDSDAVMGIELEGKQFYLIDNLCGGSRGCRSIGRNAIKYEILTHKMDSFFDTVKGMEGEEIEIIFVTSSFGGFGSAVVFELIDYLEANLWNEFQAGRGKCKILAFNEGYSKAERWPAYLCEIFTANTIEFVDQYDWKYAVRTYDQPGEREKFFNPFCSMYLLDTSERKPVELSHVLDMPDSMLAQLDVASLYKTKRVKKNAPPVFISYASSDQRIVDLLAKKLEAKGIDCWVASKSIHEGSYARQIIEGIQNSRIFIVLLSCNSVISEHVKNEIDRAFDRVKDGLKIIPFFIENVELDSECIYYLYRQEMFHGEKPPIEERIGELIEKIDKMMG